MIPGTGFGQFPILWTSSRSRTFIGMVDRAVARPRGPRTAGYCRTMGAAAARPLVHFEPVRNKVRPRHRPGRGFGDVQ